MWGFFKLITPFIDPLTREKLKFNEDMSQYVPSEQLWTEFNGSLEFEYDHAAYWPALAKMADDRREARRTRWVAGGGHIGELEDYLAGHVEQGVAPPTASAEEPVDSADEMDSKLAEAKVEIVPTDANQEPASANKPAANGLKLEELDLEDKVEAKTAGPSHEAE